MSPCHLVTLSPRPRRGAALLMVMIAMVVCSILTAGFLASQGTSIGIARNERDAEQAKAMALSGIDMCYWFMRNRSDWRLAMSPGAWLSNFPVGDGSVTVTALSADGNYSFANNTTQPVVFTSTGFYNNRSFTLTATIGPTGGGEVFRDGNYVVEHIMMGTDDKAGSAVIASINAIGTVQPNAKFTSSSDRPHALTVFASSRYNGFYTFARDSNADKAIYQTTPPTTFINTSQAPLMHVPGKVIPPNTAGLPLRGTFTQGGGTGTLSTPGQFDAITISTASNAAVLNVTASGLYYVLGNFTMGEKTTLNVPNGVDAVFVIEGNLNIVSGNAVAALQTTGTGTLKIYVKGNVSCIGSNAVITGATPGSLLLLGTGNNATFDFNTNTISKIAIYAPTAALTLSGSTTLQGVMVVKSLTMTDNATFHHNTTPELQSVRIGHLTGGSAPNGGGIADYNVSIVGTTAVVTR